MARRACSTCSTAAWPTVYRAFFEPGVRLARTCLPRPLPGGRPGCPRRASERPRHHARFVSRAPQPDIERLKARMDWKMPCTPSRIASTPTSASTSGHGTNAFIRAGDNVFRTYFVNNRGDEANGSTWSYLDITALGRQEEGGLAGGPLRPHTSGGTGTTNTATPRRRSGRAWSIAASISCVSPASVRSTTSTPSSADRGAAHRLRGRDVVKGSAIAAG